MQRNARFWVWFNCGWVKITLRPGQTLTASYGGQTDEGYSYTSETWRHDGDVVMSEWATSARDCDGRLDRYGEAECPLDLLQSRDMGEYDAPQDVGIMAPEWRKIGAGQRDYEAEAMGY